MKVEIKKKEKLIMAKKEKSPLQGAVEAGNTEMVNKMLNEGVVKDLTLSPLQLATKLAIKEGNKEPLENLINHSVEQEQGRE